MAYVWSAVYGTVLFCHKMGGGPRVVVSTAAFHAGVRSSIPGLGGLKKNKKMFLPHPRVNVSIAGSLRDREVACSSSDRQGSNFESCVWRTVSSQSSHHPQEVLLAQFSLYVHKGGLKPDSFHFILSQDFYDAIFTHVQYSLIFSIRYHNPNSYTQESYDLVFKCGNSSRLGFKYYLYIILIPFFLDLDIIYGSKHIEIGKDRYNM